MVKGHLWGGLHLYLRGKGEDSLLPPPLLSYHFALCLNLAGDEPHLYGVYSGPGKSNPDACGPKNEKPVIFLQEPLLLYPKAYWSNFQLPHQVYQQLHLSTV